MKVLRGLSPLLPLEAGAAVTIGNFDGVHRGHQALFAELAKNARRLHLPTLVVIFEPQPGEYFHKEAAPARLMTRREKLQRLSQCGIDYVYCLPFNQSLASMSPESFADCFLFSLFRAKYLLVGEDFRFGRDRQGDLSQLRLLGDALGCAVQIYPEFLKQSARVSSTRIRAALWQGGLSLATDLLGQPYSISGRVIHGDGRGRQWGFPTANLQIAHRAPPLAGVFFVRVKRANLAVFWGVANVGRRPTVGGTLPILEVHLFDFDGSLYHERIEVSFLHRLREEMKFSSIDALITQIQLDCEVAKAMRFQFIP